MTIFSPSHCFSWTVFNSENGLQPFVSPSLYIIYILILIYLNTWHLGVPKFSFKRVRVLEIHPTQPRGGHPSHSNLVRGKLTSPTYLPSPCDNPKFTPFDQRTSLAYILILCEGSGWGSMEIRGLVKILTVGWEITLFFTDSWDQVVDVKMGWN